MDLEFYVRVRTCEKRVTGKQPLDSSKFSEILNSNATLDKFSVHRIKINFKHESFVRKH